MPKAFDQREREYIRTRLKAKGAELFVQFGVRRTTVDELVKAVGISKGSFFNFFDSKEDLFLELFIERFNRVNQTFRQELANPSKPLRETLTNFLHNRFTVERNPLFGVFYNQEDFEYLNRKVAEETIQTFIVNDFKDLMGIIVGLQRQGRIADHNPETIVELFHTLFFLSVKRPELERFQNYQSDIIGVHIDLIISHLCNKD